MSSEGGRSGILGWAGPFAVLVACVAGALSGWLAGVAVAGLVRDSVGAAPSTVIGVVVFFPVAFVGFALGLVVMSLLLALVLRTLPNGDSPPSSGSAED